MIATVTNHISQGVQNYNDTSKKFTWFKTNFNMPVPNYMAANTPFTRYSGAWNYLTETTSYDLTGFIYGYEICNGCAIFDFENEGTTTYNISTTLNLKWTDASNNTLHGISFSTPVSYSLPATYYIEWWEGANIGCESNEIASSTTYDFRASASGTPNITEVVTAVSFTNVPSDPGEHTAGFVWVEGNNLAYINASQWKHSIVGTLNSSPSATPGAIWIDTSNILHWIGGDGNDYISTFFVKQFPSFYSNSSTTTVSGKTPGFFWVDNEFGQTHLAYIGNDGYKYLTGAGTNPYV